MPAVRGRTGDLPHEVNAFVGRTREVAELRSLLSSARLVTLVGPGGVGKTRLALHVAAGLARSFADGARLVELADADSAESLINEVATALGMQGRGAQQSEKIVDFLADRAMLLVLDNCEHLVADAAGIAGAVLRGCPGVRVVATSREVLRVAGEATLEVPPLAVPPSDKELSLDELAGTDSVRLFLERAGNVRPTFALTDENSDAVARIVRQLDGLPLAIELATARLPTLSAAELADRLDQRYRILTAGSRTGPARHQALRMCVGWSYDGCTEPERALWRGLTVFAGGFELDAVEGVCGFGALADSDLLDLLSSLVGKSVVVRTDSGGQSRYRLLESLRLFGWEKLEAAGEADLVSARHRDWFGGLALLTRADLLSPGQGDRWRRLDRDWLNLRAALDLFVRRPPDPDPSVEVVASLLEYTVSRGLLTEQRKWTSMVLDRASEADPARLTLLNATGSAAAVQGDLETASAMLSELMRVAEETGDPFARAFTDQLTGWVAQCSGDFQGAAEALSSATDQWRGLDNQVRLMWPLSLLAVATAFAGDLDGARATYAELTAISEATGDVFFRTMCAGALGSGLWRLGDLGSATVVLGDAIRYAVEIGDLMQCAWSIDYLAAIAAEVGDAKRGAVLLGASAAVAREFGVVSHARDLPPYAAERWARAEQTLRTRLGTTAFASAFARGRAMDYLSATAYATGLAPSPPASAPDSPTSPLSARELEVARLVHDGLTNRQIAAALFITPRTVRGHVENILAKLGFSGRSQVAAWVAQVAHR